MMPDNDWPDEQGESVEDWVEKGDPQKGATQLYGEEKGATHKGATPQPINNAPQSPEKAQARDREREALDLRLTGMSYRKIADRLSVDVATAYRRVSAALERVKAEADEKAVEVKAMELDRLDRILEVLEPRVERGDDKAIDRVLAVQQRRAKLLGLDAPVRQEMKVESVPKLYEFDPDAIAADSPPEIEDGEQEQIEGGEEDDA